MLVYVARVNACRATGSFIRYEITFPSATTPPSSSGPRSVQVPASAFSHFKFQAFFFASVGAEIHAQHQKLACLCRHSVFVRNRIPVQNVASWGRASTFTLRTCRPMARGGQTAHCGGLRSPARDVVQTAHFSSYAWIRSPAR